MVVPQEEVLREFDPKWSTRMLFVLLRSDRYS